MTVVEDSATRLAGPGRRRGSRSQSPSQSQSAMERRRRRLFWPFVIPAVLIYTAVFIGPVVMSAWVSFNRWNGVRPMEFRGVRNYTALLSDTTFHKAFLNTFLILVVVGVVTFVLAFALMTVMRDMAGRRFVRAVLFLPNILAPIVLSVFWGFVFQSGGLLNTGLSGAGIDKPPNWLGDHLFGVITLGLVWINTGFFATILLAGVDRIPPYLYEDALLGGATAFQRFRYITFPMSRDVIATSAVLWTISSVKTFEFIYAFGGTTNDLPPPKVWNTALFVYGQTFGGRLPAYNFGYASAAAIVTLLVIVVFVLVLRRLAPREPLEF